FCTSISNVSIAERCAFGGRRVCSITASPPPSRSAYPPHLEHDSRHVLDPRRGAEERDRDRDWVDPVPFPPDPLAAPVLRSVVLDAERDGPPIVGFAAEASRTFSVLKAAHTQVRRF